MIPTQLQNPDFRFILVKEKDKVPIENFWQCPTLQAAKEKWASEKADADKVGKNYLKAEPTRITQYRFDDQILQDHITSGGNYGVVCGIGGLVVIDLDRPIEELTPPQTFTVNTPSGGSHFYLICNEIKKKILLDKEGIHYGEIQAGGNTQVICPPCVAKSKVTQELTPYTITNDMPIASKTLDGIKDLLGTHFKKQTQTVNGKTKYEDSRFNLPIDRIITLTKFRQRGSEYQGEHPTHGSDGGNNFCVNTSKNVWHCFRHDCGGGSLELVGMIEGVIGCGDKLNSDQFNLVVKIAETKYGMVTQKPATPVDTRMQIFQLLATGEEDQATEMIAEDIESRYHLCTIRDDKAPEIWIYQDGVYIPHGRTYILEECRSMLEQAFTINLANNVVNKIMTDTYVNAEDFLNPKAGDWICVKNGQLNPLTKELKDFNPLDIHFTKLPVDYNPEAKCPTISAHFAEVTKDEQEVRVMEEVTGWFLLNEYKPERAVMLCGTGRNGKGKTISMWKEFLGIENISTIALHQFAEDQYAAGDLMNKRANLAGDIDGETLKNTALFKQVTGRDPISSNRKYLSRVKFTNNAKMVCAANELPHTKDMSIGFFGRWVLVDFPYRFGTPQEIATFSEEEKAKAKVADLDIINKLVTPEELSGLLNLAIEGLHRLMKQGDFSTSRTTEEVKREWLKRSDSFGAFAMEFLKEEYGGFISKQELRHVYGEYCRKNKLRVASDKVIKEKMSEQLGAFEARRSDFDSRPMVWDGVAWKGRSGEGVKGVNPFSKSILHTEDTFRNCHDTLDTHDRILVAHGGKEDYYALMDFIEKHPRCSLEELKALNIFNCERILEHLRQIGKISESRYGQYDLVSRRLEED